MYQKVLPVNLGSRYLNGLQAIVGLHIQVLERDLPLVVGQLQSVKPSTLPVGLELLEVVVPPLL
jgi:hypothetical protein